jgi:hypothetical protein
MGRRSQGAIGGSPQGASRWSRSAWEILGNSARLGNTPATKDGIIEEVCSAPQPIGAPAMTGPAFGGQNARRMIPV